jgi:hypothetical protein
MQIGPRLNPAERIVAEQDFVWSECDETIEGAQFASDRNRFAVARARADSGRATEPIDVGSCAAPVARLERRPKPVL